MLKEFAWLLALLGLVTFVGPLAQASHMLAAVHDEGNPTGCILLVVPCGDQARYSRVWGHGGNLSDPYLQSLNGGAH